MEEYPSGHKGADSKSVRWATVTQVRILSPPSFFLTSQTFAKESLCLGILQGRLDPLK